MGEMKEKREPFTHVAIDCASLQALLDDKASLEAALTRVQRRCTEQEQTIRDMKAPKSGKRPYTKPAMEELALTKCACVSEARERNLQRDLTRKTRELERVTALVNKQRETIERVRENLFDVAKERDQLKERLLDETREYEKALAAVAEQEEEHAKLRKTIASLNAMLQARREENALLEEELTKVKEGIAASEGPQDFDEELRADLANALYSNDSIAESLVVNDDDVTSLVVWARKMIEKEAELINENASLEEANAGLRADLVKVQDELSRGGPPGYRKELVEGPLPAPDVQSTREDSSLIGGMRNQISSLQGILETTETAKAELSQQLQAVQAENAALRACRAEQEEELKATKTALERSQTALLAVREEVQHLTKTIEDLQVHNSSLSEENGTLRTQVQEYKEAEADGPACDKCGSHRETHDVVCIPCLNQERKDYESELKQVRARLQQQEEVECDQCGVVFPVFAEADEDSVVLCSSCGPKQTDQIAALQARTEELGKDLERAERAKLELYDQLKQHKDKAESDKIHIELLEGKVARLEESNAELLSSNRSLTASKIQSDQAQTQRFLAAQHAKEEAVFERDNAQADKDTLITQYDRKCEELVAVQKERDDALRKLRGVYEAVRKLAPEEPLPEWAKPDDEIS